MSRPQYTARFLVDTSLQSTTVLESERWQVNDRVELLFDFITDYLSSGLVSTKLPPKPHLFVSIVEAQRIETGDHWTEMGFAAYHAGMYHILIASQKPNEASFREFLDVILPTHVFHEYKHFLQDLDGTLAFTDKCEQQAEEFAKDMLKVWWQWKNNHTAVRM